MSEIILGSAVLALVFISVAFCVIGMETWVNGAFMSRRDRIVGRLVGVAMVAGAWLVFAYCIGGNVS